MARSAAWTGPVGSLPVPARSVVRRRSSARTAPGSPSRSYAARSVAARPPRRLRMCTGSPAMKEYRRHSPYRAPAPGGLSPDRCRSPARSPSRRPSGTGPVSSPASAQVSSPAPASGPGASGPGRRQGQPVVAVVEAQDHVCAGVGDGPTSSRRPPVPVGSSGAKSWKPPSLPTTVTRTPKVRAASSGRRSDAAWFQPASDGASPGRRSWVTASSARTSGTARRRAGSDRRGRRTHGVRECPFRGPDPPRRSPPR